MVNEDFSETSYISASDVEGKINEERKRQYRNLLSEIYHGLSVAQDYDGSVTLFKNLDNAERLPAGVYLRRIEPKWFIIYQRTDD
jgi:hypothetical protein